MSVRTLRSFEALADQLPHEAAGRRAVVLDALHLVVLHRTGETALQTAVALWLRERLRRLGSAPLPELDELCRTKAALAPGRGVDVPRLAQLQDWARAWGPAAEALAPELHAREQRLQQLAWAPAPGIPELLARLQQTGTRTLVVARSQRSSQELLALLECAGLGGLVDAAYTAAAGEQPALQALAQEGLAVTEALYVSAEAADARAAAAQGLRSLHVSERSELQRRHRLEVACHNAQRNPFWCAHLAEEVLRAAPQRMEAAQDASYRTGRQLAPAMAAFVVDVLEQARTRGISRLFFLAREGLTFLRLFAILSRSGAFGPLPEVRYLYVSRASTILASMRELSWPELSRFWRQYPRQSLLDLLRNLSLPADEFLPLAAACGLETPQRPILEPEQDAAFQRFLAAAPVQEAFLRHRDQARARLRDYLQARGFFAEAPIGLVDIGWKGSMQDNLLRAFGEDPALPEVHGFYLGYTDSGPLPPRSFKYGFLADTRRQDLEENDLFRNSAILEMATQAHHGSTIGYAPNPWAPHRLVPVLLQHPVERENSERYFRRMQQALYDYAHDFAELRELLPFSAEQLRPGVLAGLLRYMRYPTRQEAAEFLQYSHVESFGVAEITTFDLKLDLRTVLALRHPRRMLGELRRSLERNPWTESVIRRSGLPLGNLLYDAFRTLDQER